MIEISYKQDNGKHNIQITGHAGYGEYGQDIVCAAVSMLTYTLIMALDKIPSSKISKKYNAASGYTSCITESLVDDPELEQRVKVIHETILGGLEMLADQYPEHVKFNV